tara:strand:- start:2737 stop:3714 length:978 start_codon:yes stop_codon:yes gene_type:complete
MSNRFRNFKEKNNQFNLSCPYCGDSTKNKFKARGYLLTKKGAYYYYCHNCSISKKFDQFINDHDPMLYREYKLEKLKDSSNLEKTEHISTSTVKTSSFPSYRQSGSPLRKLKKVSQLDWNHPVKKYIQNRMIPNKYHAKLFYCPKFYQWTNSIVPGKFKEEGKDESRLIIPFLDEKGNMFGFQGRSLSAESNLRYITIMLDESKSKLYGLDELDSGKTVYVVEGPFDSMFVSNAVAMAGSDVTVPFKDVVMVYDNEPRNKEIVKKMEKSIDQGRKIVVWPSKINHKDVNDMVIAGMRCADIRLIIQNNTFSDLSAKMALNVWKRI